MEIRLLVFLLVLVWAITGWMSYKVGMSAFRIGGSDELNKKMELGDRRVALALSLFGPVSLISAAVFYLTTVLGYLMGNWGKRKSYGAGRHR